MGMKLIVSDIGWFCPGMPKNMDAGLPKQVTVDDPILLPHLLEDIDGEATNLTEWLAQEYGCAVTGFTTDIKGVGGHD